MSATHRRPAGLAAAPAVPGLVLVLAVVLALGGCGAGGDAVRPAATPTAATPSGATPSGATVSQTPGPEPTEDLTVTPPRTGATITLSGVVEAGVENGCLLLPGAGGPFLLVGAATRGVEPGQSVTVTGSVNAGLMTTCQQGTPFEVATLTTS